MAFVDTTKEPWRIQTFAVPQLTAANVVETRETLPSFHYQQAPDEFAPGALRLPWDVEAPRHVVGFFARDHGGGVAARLVASAKSWLCHTGVDRLAELLPWHGAADVDKLSPVEASSRYLAHLRAAWNHRFARYPLEQQDVVLTLPASFDEIARDLTVKAAARAGLPRVVLIEEPQAAFYAWIYEHGADWEQRVSPGQKILVCDIGGGTSDFTLIRVRQEAGGKVQFHREAVGDHLILGGDNLDLALAHHLEQRLVAGGKLDARGWGVLLRSCRQAKETLLGENPPAQLTVNVPGGGSRLIGGSRQVEVTREDVEQQLVEGFLPRVPLDARPSPRRSGFQEFGLPYATDSAITRYLAAFLSAHRRALTAGKSGDAVQSAIGNDSARPDLVLFNGGLFASPVLRQRLLDVLSDWFSPPDATTANPRWRPEVLQNQRLDLAVAWGAAYYGMVRRGQGTRIAAGLPRSYYIGVGDGQQTEPQAVCLLPAGLEEGQSVDLTERRFELLIRQPVEFPLLVSSTRLSDRPGQLISIDPEQMTALPPIRTVLQSSKKSAAADAITVNLHARLTEIGTLELWCSELAGPRTWRLQFDVRATTQTDRTAHDGVAEQLGIVDDQTLVDCRQIVAETFGPPANKDKQLPEQIMKRLSQRIGSPRQEWPPSLLRNLWETLLECEAGRKFSPIHEARWLNLLGFSLRPGYGLAVDDWRVSQTWRALHGKLVNANPMCRAERWILWRRIAGGLTAGQQRALAEPLIAEYRQWSQALAKGRGGEFRPGAHEAAELWRLLGALELLSVAWKIELGDILLGLAAREKADNVRNAAIWALGRLAARVPMYGPLNIVVPVEVAERWLQRLLGLRSESETASFAAMQAARRTEDRYRDVSDPLRQEVAAWLRARNAPQHYVELVLVGGQLQAEEQGLMFGESLPQGLRLSTG